MKNKFKYLTVIGCMIGLLTSCSDYLDTAPKDIYSTIEESFQRKTDTERYLANVYKYIRSQYQWSDGSPWTSISDEVDVTYAEYDVSRVNEGALSAKNTYCNFWPHYYRGIRAATYFIQHVDENQEMTQQLKTQYKAEARLLRAWFYFSLFSQYGPVVILPEQPIASDANIESMSLARSSISETISYIENEIRAVIGMNVLPKRVPDLLNYGRITEATCYALLSRVLLYAASDFYNGDINTMYTNFKNKDGKLLFDYTNDGAQARWEKAANAAKYLIDNYGFKLYKEYDGVALNPYRSCKNVFLTEWNDEVIYAKPQGGLGGTSVDQACSPRVISSNAWNGWGATQEIVDAFFTKNGLPIDKDPTYSETGFTTAAGDEIGGKPYTEKNTYKMYTNREPRFYVSICFSNSRWIKTDNDVIVNFYAGGECGWNQTSNARNFSKTGYLAKKLVSPSSDPANGKWSERHQIYFRLAEFYLNYAEALCRANFSANKAMVVEYINHIRERAGIPLYGSLVGEIPVPATEDDMMNAIKMERRVELAFESHRYFDCKRWIISEQTDGGAIHGMNAYQGNGEGNFYKRTVVEIRAFDKQYYLWPINVNENYKDGLLVQNPGW